MNSFDTLFFPETAIFSENRYPLLLFFTPLHFLQVVEPGPGPGMGAEADHFLERGLCQAHVPAPLGDNRDPFLRLIHEIRERKEHLLGQLSGLATGLSHAPAGEEPVDFEQSIVSSLLQKYAVQRATTGTELQLWQARLVLTIAEILDSDEEALREQLFFFNEDEIATFRSLQGAADPNEEDLFSEVEGIKARLEETRLGNSTKRFAAWLRLLQNQPLPPVKVWLASTRDSADQIFNRYETSSNVHTVPLLKLALPAQLTASGKYVVEQIEAFQQTTMPIHRGLVADFARIVTTVPYLRDGYESLLPFGTDWAEQWEGALDDFFPASSDGRQDVTFYLLPEQPIGRLLAMPESPGVAHEDPAHGLLAVIG